MPGSPGPFRTHRVAQAVTLAVVAEVEYEITVIMGARQAVGGIVIVGGEAVVGHVPGCVVLVIAGGSATCSLRLGWRLDCGALLGAGWRFATAITADFGC